MFDEGGRLLLSIPVCDITGVDVAEAVGVIEGVDGCEGFVTGVTVEADVLLVTVAVTVVVGDVPAVAVAVVVTVGVGVAVGAVGLGVAVGGGEQLQVTVAIALDDLPFLVIVALNWIESPLSEQGILDIVATGGGRVPLPQLPALHLAVIPGVNGGESVSVTLQE